MSDGKSTPGLKGDASPKDLAIFLGSLVLTLIITVVAVLTVGVPGGAHEPAKAATADVAQPTPTPTPTPKPNLFMRLQGVEGLDTDASPTPPPAFHLAVDTDWIPPHYRYCSGGGNSMLRVSYHDIILAWGHVPWFCVEGSQVDGGAVDGVVTVEAKAEAAVLREE